MLGKKTPLESKILYLYYVGYKNGSRRQGYRHGDFEDFTLLIWTLVSVRY